MAGGGAGTGGSPQPVSANGAVLTNHYDNARTGSTLGETILTTRNVNKGTFGLLFTRALKGAVYGQPLYLPGIMINGAKHNVVYVATEHNMIYAYDADDPAAATPLWSKMFEAPLALGNGFPSCGDMSAAGEVGITATPVIDPNQGKIFLVTKSTDGQRLHALDVSTGVDVPAPVMISAGPGFDSRNYLNRPGLLLLDGVVYAGFGSHCDQGPYHGYVFAFDAKTLESKGVFNTTPNGGGGAIWQSGIGLAGDASGVLFCVGNGTVGGANVGESVVRVKQMGGGLAMTAHFTPSNSAALNAADNDLAAGVILIPGTNLMVSGGKEGPIYVLDDTLTLKQSINSPAANGGDALHSLTAWNGSIGTMVFVWPSGGQLYGYGVANGSLTLKSTGGPKVGHPGGAVTVSSNGAMPETGVAWATVPRLGDSWHGTAIGALFAFDASDVSKELWNSDAAPQDALGNYAKFSPPTVANGKVYVATFSGRLMVYGLKP
jgi:outer membrane protein assembly factor BamB